jgi:hypothetical protein
LCLQGPFKKQNSPIINSMKTETKATEQQQIPLQPLVDAVDVPVPEHKNQVTTVAEKRVESVPDLPSFSNSATFEHAQRVAKMLSSSELIPQAYRGNVQNTMIALELANRIGASPLQVMQNLYIVQGKPSWSSSFIIAAINACRKFSPLRFEVTGEGDSLTCVAWAYDLANGDKLEGPMITMQMAKEEGWLGKAGSKWKTMPSLMIRYRAAAFFGRLYAPEILMGMQTMEEVVDVTADQEAKASIANRAKEAYE